MHYDFIKRNWEYLYLAIQIGSLAYLFFFFFNQSFLPSPFVLDKSNTFMDFYNPLSWVYKPSLYESTITVYPPLNFVFLQGIAFGFTLLGIKPDTAECLRAQSAFFQILLVAIYFFIAWWVVYINLDKTRTLLRRLCLALALALSMPVLFAIERGNLIVIALLFLSIYIACPDKKSLPALILVAILINIKPYFALLALVYLPNFKTLCRLASWSGLIFVLTGISVDPQFYLFFNNLFFFKTIGGGIPAHDLLTFPSSVLALKGLTVIFPWTQHYIFWFSLLKVCLYLTITFLIIIIIFNKTITDNDKVIGIVMMITNYSATSGGYSLIYYLPILPLLIHQPQRKIIYYLLLVLAPLDWISFYQINLDVFTYTYLGSISGTSFDNYWVLPYQNLYVGTFLRPIVNFWLFASFTYYLMRKQKS
jgi:hypothetical protein